MNEVTLQINPVYLLAKFSKGTRNFSFDVGSVFAQKSFEILFQPKVQKKLEDCFNRFHFFAQSLEGFKSVDVGFC